MNKIKLDNLIFILFSIFPITIIVGPVASFLNVIFISIFSITFIVTLKEYNFIKSQSIIFLIILFFYLLFNTLISIDYNYSILRNFGFLRFIFLFVAINFLFIKIKNIDFAFKLWLSTIILIICDSFIEFKFGTNILGYGQDLYSDRIVSFFKDEPIVAAFLNGFFFIVIGYLFDSEILKKNYKYVICFILIILFLFCVTITGERSNTIKALFGLLIFFLLNKKFSFLNKFLIFLSSFVIFVFIVINSDYLKYRYFELIINPLTNYEDSKKFLNENKYIKHYKSGYSVFKNYPYFGVGNKNYRIETRDHQFTKKNYIPDTHPHQIYFEFLSEHGLFGTFILLFIFLFLIFKKLKICLSSKNSLQLGAFSYLMTCFLPFVPSGSFFSDFNITLFFLNFSIFYACNPNSNIFKNKA